MLASVLNILPKPLGYAGRAIHRYFEGRGAAF